MPLDEDGLEVPPPAEGAQATEPEARGRKKETDKKERRTEREEAAAEPGESQASAQVASKKSVPANHRNKSIQPQRLRKIADGLVEFERYADRKKRLQSITDKQERDARVKNMNM